MSNTNAQKRGGTSGPKQKQGKDTTIDNISEATKKKIENISHLTSWHVPEDIFNLLKDCNFDEALTIDKILSGDAGRPGEEWTQVTRPRKIKEPQAPEQPQEKPLREKQNRGRPGPRGARANGQPGGKRGGSYRQGKRSVGDNRAAIAQPDREPSSNPESSNVPPPSGVPMAQQYSTSPSTTHIPSHVRGPVGQRPHNGRRSPARDQPRGGVPKPKTQAQGQLHVHSQTHAQNSPPTTHTPQAQLRDAQPQQAQEHSKTESHERTEQRQIDSSVVKGPSEESQAHTPQQVPQTQQGQQGHGNHVQPPRGQSGSLKKAPGKAQPGSSLPQQTHTNKAHHSLPPKGRRGDNRVWQAKEAPGGQQLPSNRPLPVQSIAHRQSPEPQIVRQSSPVPPQNSIQASPLPAEDTPQMEKAAVILPSDLNAYDSDDTEANLNLHFGNFGQTASPAPKAEVLDTRAQRPSAASRTPVARPVATPPPKEKDLEPLQPTQANNAVSQPLQTRKTATRPPEKKAPAPTQQQQPYRPTAPVTGMGLEGDELSFAQQTHMQMNPQTFSYNPAHFHFLPTVSAPAAFGLSEIDPTANPSLSHHSQVNYYDPQQNFPQASAYRASSPHQGDVSSKYPYSRDTKYPQQQQSQASSSPAADRHEKHRQDNGSPPPRASASPVQQVHPQSPQSPPPSGQHPSQQPQPHPYSIPSQYPQLYGYPYQYYPGASSQYTPNFSRGYPVHYPKHFPNLSATSSGGYPISPPTSAGYPEDVQMLSGDYHKSYMPAMQSFFHTGVPDPATGGAVSTPSHVGVNQNPNSDAAAGLPYKIEYSSGDVRGNSSAFYKSYTQPPSHQTQFGGAQQAGQYGQQAGQYPQGNSGQFPFVHHQPHPHHMMQAGQQQPQQPTSNQGQPSSFS